MIQVDPQVYLEKCRNMVRLNKEQLNETLYLIKQTPDLNKKKDLKMEAQGWAKWLKFWEEQMVKAEEMNG